MQRKIDKIKNRIRILKQWKIRYTPATETAQAIVAFSFNHKKTATEIFSYFKFGRKRSKGPRNYATANLLKFLRANRR